MRGNRAQFVAPRLDTYGVAVLELQ
jgi:hypothetical protein